MDTIWYFFDDIYQVDATTNTLFKHGKDTRLREMSVKMLIALLDRPNRFLNAEELKTAGGSAAGESPAKGCMSEIRDILGKKLIPIDTGQGYRFVGKCRKEVITMPPLRLAYVERKEELFAHSFDKAQMVRFAKEIDMLGWNLNRYWFSDSTFVSLLGERITAGDLRLRIMLPDLRARFFSAMLQDRSTSLTDESMTKVEAKEFLGRYYSTLQKLQLISAATDDRLHFIESSLVCSGFMRFDNIVIISLYAFPHHGPVNPAILINLDEAASKGTNDIAGKMAARWTKAFNDLWPLTRKTTREELATILKELLRNWGPNPPLQLPPSSQE